MDAGDAGAHLAALAREPRPAGGDAEARARAYASHVLRESGFSVSEEPFSYSAMPGRWGTPLAGACSALVLAIAAGLGARGAPGVSLMTMIAGLALIAVGGTWLARRGVISLGTMRASSVNLVAERARASEKPTVWLAAHLDSKSQPVPMLVRASAIVISVAYWVAMVSLAVTDLLSCCGAGVGAHEWAIIGAIGVLASLPLAASTVGARSAGALDNASGVATVLAAASRLPAESNVGVLLTSAEELGLAGARSWVRGRRVGTIVNVDGVDDTGVVIAMWSGKRPDVLLARAVAAGVRCGVAVRPRRLLPGVLTDGVAFADAGWGALTLSRGTVRTLARIHRPTDSLDALGGDGIDDVARIASALASELASSNSPRG